MRAQTVHAIVLRRRDLGDADRRLTLLTEELGVFDAIAKGARKGGSRLGGSSEPLSVSVMHLALGKKLWYVTQAQPITSYPGLRADYARLSLAFALAEIASAVLPHEQPVPEAFRFIVNALRYLEVHERPLVSAVWAESRFLNLAGFTPVLDRCVDTGGPVPVGKVFVSAAAGGALSGAGAGEARDAIAARFEAIVGLAKIAALDAPPENLRFAGECYRVLLEFWRHYAEHPLPARERAQLEANGDA